MKVIHSFQEIIVPSYRLLEWCCLMAFSFCHRRAALPPPPLVKWRVLQDSKWVRNAPKPIFFFFFWCSGVSVQTAGNAFASCIFSSTIVAATISFKQTSRKKSLNCWKKELPDSSYTHCPSNEALIPISTQKQVSGEKSRKGDKSMVMHLWKSSRGSMASGNGRRIGLGCGSRLQLVQGPTRVKVAVSRMWTSRAELHLTATCCL